MPLPQNTQYPLKATLADWNKARKGVKKDIKTGMGAKLKLTEAAWKAIAFTDLNLNVKVMDLKPGDALERGKKADAAYLNVGKARTAIQAAQAVATKQSTNKALNDVSRLWLTTAAHQVLPALDKSLADMADIKKQITKFNDEVRMDFGPGGRVLQQMAVEQMWDAVRLKGVSQQDAELALQMARDAAWLVRASGADSFLSRRQNGIVVHLDLKATIDSGQSPTKFGLSDSRRLGLNDVAAARVAAKHVAKLDGQPDPNVGAKAQSFKKKLEQHAAPTGEQEWPERSAVAYRAWIGHGALTVSKKDTEVALKVSKDGSWLVRKDGRKSMLSVHKGAQIMHQDLSPLVTNFKWPKDLSLSDANRLDADGVSTALQAARHVKRVVGFPDKLVELRALPGYFANLDANAAAQKLSAAAAGAWVVRASSQSTAAAWSRKLPDGTVGHYRIANQHDYDVFTKYAKSAGQLQVKA